jgi:hypothetical protein
MLDQLARAPHHLTPETPDLGFGAPLPYPPAREASGIGVPGVFIGKL